MIMQKKPLVAVSLKMYFSLSQTLGYCREVALKSGNNEAINSGSVELAVFPSFLALNSTKELFYGTRVHLGAQDVCQEEVGAFTGEVSINEIIEVGCQFVELGHAERKTIYGESNEMTQQKTLLTLDKGLTPLLCIGEADYTDPKLAATLCVEQALHATNGGTEQEICFGYEPYWAIGQDRPAPTNYVIDVCNNIADTLADSFPDSRLLYGGSAGPGLLHKLEGAVDGLFLGRFAHRVDNLLQVVNEAATLTNPAFTGVGSPADKGRQAS